MLCGRDPADGADGMVEKLVSTEQRMIELSLQAQNVKSQVSAHVCMLGRSIVSHSLRPCGL